MRSSRAWACAVVGLALVGAAVAVMLFSKGGSRASVLEIIPPGSHRLILVESTTARVLRQLPVKALLDVEPSWSPDGKRVVYVGLDAYGNSNGIYVSDGKKVRRIVSGGDLPLQPEWSPDGKKVVFVSLHSGSMNFWGMTHAVWVVNADGTNLRLLTHNAAFDDSDPRWSPDGTQLAFAVGTNNGPAQYGGSTPRWGVAVMPATGGKPCLVYVTSWQGTIGIDGPGFGEGGVDWQPGSAPRSHRPTRCLSLGTP